ncbi:MAG: amino acid racemase [Epsilonproteobacteria bacterium]|nr:amino acid racemase [Campylobacterota bacterium]
MKKVGIIGGLGPQTTIDYYTSIIAKYQEKVGIKDDLPELVINSINMYDIYRWLANNEIEELTTYITNAVRALEKSGADFVVIAGNTPHIVFKEIQRNIAIPMISIVEETYQAAQRLHLKKVGFLGTQFTMENDFFKKPFIDNNIQIIIPNASERVYIHQKITDELFKNIINLETHKRFSDIIYQMVKEESVEGIILGCTELPLLFKNQPLGIPLLNPAEIHIEKIVDTLFQI